MPEVQLMDGANVADSSSLNVSQDSSPNMPDSISSEQLQKTEEETKEKDKTPETKTEANDEWMDILGSGHLKMKITKKGDSETRSQPPDICEINLTGTLVDGTVVENYKALKIQLGCHEVVQGLELAIPFMGVGDEALVVVAPRFGYGSMGNPPHIPPDATITYSITLINFYPEPDLESISFEKRKSLANSKKERGNWWYSRQDATKAIQCYRKALDILDETIAFSNKDGNSTEYTEDQIKNIIEFKLVIYNNLAAAQLMISAYESALMSVNRVLQCDPKNVKALFRKGKILVAMGQVNEAVEVLRQAFLLEPENSAIKMELSRCVKLQQTEKQYEKKLYRKMFGQDKKSEKSAAASKRKLSCWTKLLGTAATATIMAAIAFTVCYRFKNSSFL